MPKKWTKAWADEQLALEILQAKERHKQRLAYLREKPRALASKEAMARLARQTAKLRNNGQSNQEIAALIGLSPSRIAQLVDEAKRNERLTEAERALPTRAYHALWYFFGGKFDPERVAKLSRREMLKAPNLGKRSLQAIDIWLAKHRLYLQP